ncbi:hypothetical protein AXF42_Ash016929 [Apostasia shenzhenica]|uniref:Uncharacterized protein n=1 Tax=Apostasia shenzhenica TaxID=1088818 RepID=A0A2H9ZRI8_9ASPA|nr:hypothetical protein AXF42_Ash016929 [Apostasia shenzhenica]
MTDEDLMLIARYKKKFEERLQQEGKEHLTGNEKCQMYLEGLPAPMQDLLREQQYSEYDKLLADSEIVTSNLLVHKARECLRSGRVIIKM